MENIKIENQENNLEQIKEKLFVEWKNTFDSLIENKFSKTAKDKIKETEFNKIIKTYQEQDRSEKSYENLLNSLQNSNDGLEKLAIFYKDIYYNKEGSLNKNKEKSLDIANDFLDLLDEEQKKEFKNIF